MSEPTLLKRIMIAEDDPAVLHFFKTLITRSGYECVGTASTGVDAVSMAQSLKPDLLILDFHMPLLNGIEVLGRITPTDNMAIVFVTADPDPVVARQALNAGAAGYLLKPCDALQVVPMLETAWHRFQTVRVMKAESKALQETLDLRKLMEQAKGILMEQQGFTESEAHRLLQKMSQDQGILVKDVCRSLIQVRLALSKRAVRRTA